MPKADVRLAPGTSIVTNAPSEYTNPCRPNSPTMSSASLMPNACVRSPFAVSAAGLSILVKTYEGFGAVAGEARANTAKARVSGKRIREAPVMDEHAHAAAEPATSQRRTYVWRKFPDYILDIARLWREP